MMSGTNLVVLIITSVVVNISSAQDIVVTIVSNPAGTSVSGSNTFDYPILSSVTLICMATATDGSIFNVTNYQWDTTGCYTNPAHNSGNPTCFPTGQTTQSVTGNDLTAEDAGTITCTVTIGGVDGDYTSGPLTLRISGIAVTGVLIGNSDIVTGNLLTDYSYIDGTDNGLVARCVSGLGPTGTNDNTALGIWYFNGAQLPYGLCENPVVNVIQSRIAGLMNFVGVINLWQCEPTLTITAEGVYTCVITDSSMMNQTRRLGVYLSGRTAPMIDPPSSSTVAVIVDSPLTLSCTSRGSPPDTFTWRKDSGSIVQSTNITAVTHDSTSAVFRADYSINGVSISDSGTYTCTVTNPIGSSSEVISVSVLANGAALTPNVTVTALNTQIVGQSLTLECNVTTVRGIISTVDIIWSSDSRQLERMEGVNVGFTTTNSVVYTDTYNISQLNTTDDGREYQCEVVINTSPPVMANDSVTLDVMIPLPTVTISPSGPIQGAMVGNPQMMECRVSTVSGVESSSVMISWMGPGGDTIINDNRVTISPTNSSDNNYTSSIWFTYLMEGDNGTYTCNVMILETNESVSVELGMLTVPTPSVTVTAPNTQIVSQSLTLECSVTAVRGITSRVDVIWSRDGTELERMEGVSVSSTTDNSVEYTDTYISQLNTADDGREYQCEVVINTSPPVMADDSVTLDVMVPPINVTTSPSDTIQSAMVGDTQTLECLVSSVSGVEFNSVMISWMGPGGDTITNDSRMTISPTSSSGNNYTSSIQFTYLMEGDNGTYTCNAMILETNESASVLLRSLTVPSPFVNVTAPNTQTVGQSLTLECSVTTVRGITSTVDIIWSSDGTQLERMEGVNVSSTTDNSVVYTDTYNISQLSTTVDGREYQCEAVINTSPPVMANYSVTLDVMVFTPTPTNTSRPSEPTSSTPSIALQSSVTPTNTSRPPGDNNLLGLEEWLGALIIVIAFLLATGFCIALGLMIGAICRHKHKRRKPPKSPKRKLSSADDKLDYIPLETAASVPTSPTEMAIFYPKTTAATTEPLTIDELHKSTKKIPTLYQEFESIPKLIITETVYVGIQDKNRVEGYLPSPESRVLLSSSFPESTYINANYIKGYDGAKKYYIATQAPLRNTISDFWQMVWEQKPALVVMIEEENETINYWPDTDEVVHQKYGLITVTVRKRIVKPDYTVSTFRLAHAAEEKYRDIEHYWYKKWGAYQLPHDTTGVIALLQEIYEAKKSQPGPIVVHCSDGLGRSGALIATDIARLQLENEDKVDMVNIVTTMREDRGGMISTKEQYAFVYQILSDWAKNLHAL